MEKQQKLKLDVEELIQQKQRKKQHQGALKWQKERIPWWRTIWHHGKRPHTSDKEDAFINNAADDAIIREEQSIDGENILFENKLYFSLEIMFVFKVRQLVEFLKKARLLHEKRQ